MVETCMSNKYGCDYFSFPNSPISLNTNYFFIQKIILSCRVFMRSFGGVFQLGEQALSGQIARLSWHLAILPRVGYRIVFWTLMVDHSSFKAVEFWVLLLRNDNHMLPVDTLFWCMELLSSASQSDHSFTTDINTAVLVLHTVRHRRWTVDMSTAIRTSDIYSMKPSEERSGHDSGL